MHCSGVRGAEDEGVAREKRDSHKGNQTNDPQQEPGDSGRGKCPKGRRPQQLQR
jgi:hypothetical protein